MTEPDSEIANAIRYALLRRVSSGIRHRLLGELQAIESLADLAGRQLRLDTDSDQMLGGLSRIMAHARNASASCRSMAEWLRPEPGSTIPLGQGIAQCLEVAGDDWPLRGIEATTRLGDEEVLVDRTALRELFTAILVTLIDMHPGALDIRVQSVTEGEYINVEIHAVAGDRRSSITSSGHERRFTWADVQVLASAHGVPCICHAHGATLRLRPPTERV